MDFLLLEKYIYYEINLKVQWQDNEYCTHFMHANSLSDGWQYPLPFTKKTGSKDLQFFPFPITGKSTFNQRWLIQLVVLNKWLEKV